MYGLRQLSRTSTDGPYFSFLMHWARGKRSLLGKLLGGALVGSWAVGAAGQWGQAQLFLGLLQAALLGGGGGGALQAAA